MQNRKSVLITGTSSGFGLLTAIALAQKGYIVYATMRNLSKQQNLLTECEKVGVSVKVRALDVTRPETILPVVEEIEKDCGGPDVLLNNAGFSLNGFFENTTNEHFTELFATNFYGAINCIRAVLPGMRTRRNGLIINVSSIFGILGYPVVSVYSSAKFALEGLSESLRYEIKKFGIYVTLLEPGYFRTEIISQSNSKYAFGPEEFDRENYIPYEQLRKAHLKVRGQNPQRVVRKIIDIIETAKPKLRYTVGKDADQGSFIKKWLPSGLFEKLMEIHIREKGRMKF